MQSNKWLLVKIIGEHGRSWEFYEDGTVVGFPPGVTVINHIKPLLDFLRGHTEVCARMDNWMRREDE